MPRERLNPGEFGRILVKRSAAAGKPIDHWVAYAYIRDADGVRRQVEASSRKSSEDARRSLQNKLTKRVAPHTDRAITRRTTLAQLYDYWITAKTAPEAEDRIEPQSATTYRSAWEKHGLKPLGALRIGDVSTSVLDARIREVATDTAGGARTLRAVLSGMFGVAARFDAVSINPVRETARPRAKRGDVRALTIAQFHELRRIVIEYSTVRKRPGPIPGAILPAVLDMLAATGARIGEVLALRWEDVDLLADPPVVHLRGTLVTPRAAGEKHRRQEYRKGGSPDLTVILPAFAVETLALRIGETGKLTGLVFPARNGSPMSEHNLRTSLRKAVADTEFDWITPHTLRKMVTTLVRDHYGITAASMQAGHSSEAVTSAHYVERRKMAPDHRDVLDRLG